MSQKESSLLDMRCYKQWQYVFKMLFQLAQIVYFLSFYLVTHKTLYSMNKVVSQSRVQKCQTSLLQITFAVPSLCSEPSNVLITFVMALSRSWYFTNLSVCEQKSTSKSAISIVMSPNDKHIHNVSQAFSLLKNHSSYLLQTLWTLLWDNQFFSLDSGLERFWY